MQPNRSLVSRRAEFTRTAIAYACLIAIALVAVGPLLWLLSTALKSADENIFQYPPDLLPRSPTLANFWRVWQENPFGLYVFNSVLVSSVTVLFNLLFCSLAAYPLARFQFRGKSLIFWAIVGTSMIPFQITMIPLYVLAVQLGLRNSYVGLIFPYIASAFGI
ncbi:MAG: carbohydrate ABC transporter permease, partial [Cyanobacteria bacterium J06648_11]